ncbi:TetR family transcriptional regulator [bacterium]|nr:TetR family transcriptional regulator [bacterium]
MNAATRGFRKPCRGWTRDVPSNQFERSDVIVAALAVVRAQGINQLSARRVARELGASTAPVYSNFAGMGELATAVRRRIADLVLAETEVVRSGEPFLDMGVGVLEFARREPALYDAAFGAASDGEDTGLLVMETLLDRMSRVESLAGLGAAERTILLRKMAIFTHGLAMEIIAGRVDAAEWAGVLTILSEVGRAVVTDALGRPPRSEAEIALLAHLCDSRPDAGGDSGKGDWEC